jgi:hypothetical protein
MPKESAVCDVDMHALVKYNGAAGGQGRLTAVNASCDTFARLDRSPCFHFKPLRLELLYSQVLCGPLFSSMFLPSFLMLSFWF